MSFNPQQGQQFTDEQRLALARYFSRPTEPISLTPEQQEVHDEAKSNSERIINENLRPDIACK